MKQNQATPSDTINPFQTLPPDPMLEPPVAELLDYFYLSEGLPNSSYEPLQQLARDGSNLTEPLPDSKYNPLSEDTSNQETPCRLQLELSFTPESITAQVQRLQKWRQLENRKIIANIVLKQFIKEVPSPEVITANRLTRDKFDPSENHYAACYLIFAAINLPPTPEGAGPLAVKLVHQRFGKDEKTGKFKTELDSELPLNIAKSRIVIAACHMLYLVTRNIAIKHFSTDLRAAIEQNDGKPIVKTNQGGSQKGCFRLPMYKGDRTLRSEDGEFKLSSDKECIFAQVDKLNRQWGKSVRQRGKKKIKEIANLVLKAFIKAAAPIIISKTLSPDNFKPSPN